MRHCTVSIVGKDGQTHKKEVDATSLFDAADELVQDWHRLWWWSSSSLISGRIRPGSLASESGEREEMAQGEKPDPAVSKKVVDTRFRKRSLVNMKPQEICRRTHEQREATIAEKADAGFILVREDPSMDANISILTFEKPDGNQPGNELSAEHVDEFLSRPFRTRPV